jgi:hypothetical protein
MQNTFKYKATVVGSLLLCRIQLVPLMLVPIYLNVDANRIISMIMDLYRRFCKCNNEPAVSGATESVSCRR